MGGGHFLNEPLRVFTDQPAMAHVQENLDRKRIALFLQILEARGELFIHRPLDPVPDVYICVSENAVIRLFADQAAVLILPARPCGFRIQYPIGFLDAASGDLRQKALAQLPGPTHNDEEKSREEE